MLQNVHITTELYWDAHDWSPTSIRSGSAKSNEPNELSCKRFRPSHYFGHSLSAGKIIKQQERETKSIISEAGVTAAMGRMRGVGIYMKKQQVWWRDLNTHWCEGKEAQGWVPACGQTDAVKRNLEEKWFNTIKKKNDISYQKTKPTYREKTCNGCKEATGVRNFPFNLPNNGSESYFL